MEIKVKGRDRRRLKSVAHEIFVRLVVDREASHVNSVQDQALLAAVLGFLLAAIVGIYLFAVHTGVWAVLQAAVMGQIDPAIQPIVLIAGAFIISCAIVLSLRAAISRSSYNLVGWLMIVWRRLRPRSDSARRNIADMKYWLRSDPERIRNEVQDRYCVECAQVLPKSVATALRDLADQKVESGYVAIHGLFERKYGFLYALSGFRTPRPGERGGGDESNYFIMARAIRNAIKVAICFEALDVELRDEAANGERWWWDYYSRADYQHVPMWDEHDLPIRFRTASPHLRWPTPANASSDGEIPLFRAFSGLENPMEFPVRLLEVRDVIAEMPTVAASFFAECAPETPHGIERRRRRAANALARLANLPVKMIGRHDYQTLLPVLGRDATDRPLLTRLDGGEAPMADPDPDDLLAADWGVRWDPSRIAWSEFKPASDSELMQALAMFNDAINLAMRKPEKLHNIVLKRGSVLFIDNRRCLVSRFERETTPGIALKRLAFHPAEWWLRRFYGFRKSRNNDWSGRDSQQRFSPPSASLAPSDRADAA